MCSRTSAAQELRMEELRDTHRLESASQVELVDQLRAQLDETSAKLAAASSAAALETSSQKAAVTQLTAELDKAKNLAKEEEEKRTKAISLLKTVRTKLVKAEKDREEKEKEAVREKDERERMVAEMKRLETDVERGRSEREREVRALREQFEKEVANVRERFEREAAARKGQFELDAITTKARNSCFSCLNQCAYSDRSGDAQPGACSQELPDRDSGEKCTDAGGGEDESFRPITATSGRARVGAVALGDRAEPDGRTAVPAA